MVAGHYGSRLFQKGSSLLLAVIFVVMDISFDSLAQVRYIRVPPPNPLDVPLP
jgi:hypothetical protein